MEYLIVFLVASALAVGILSVIYHQRSKSPPPGPSIVDEALAMESVWYGTYGRTDPPPTIQWVTGTGLNCHNGTGWKNVVGDCVAGETWFELKMSKVAWVPGEPIHETGFAHELGHHVVDRDGHPDPDHTGPMFALGGLKDQANTRLESLGL